MKTLGSARHAPRIPRLKPAATAREHHGGHCESTTVVDTMLMGLGHKHHSVTASGQHPHQGNLERGFSKKKTERGTRSMQVLELYTRPVCRTRGDRQLRTVWSSEGIKDHHHQTLDGPDVHLSCSGLRIFEGLV